MWLRAEISGNYTNDYFLILDLVYSDNNTYLLNMSTWD